ncbi:hypothetical protein A3SI_12269 [Nitritalea halalkaliphila LW7]|uniref:DUF2062 domain-containing protein n=1 Tax=Nitritalea halalkaliphila LW7 TaxID=1189621 RepID=I5C1W7_9BACT|nr:DUF2062 domain-containing protein [Nitritalea halalkaliphila]EIM75819.1 hypothetical protein A3SI_12269 [Nitritalea halalkaliphila LW7]
MLRKLKQLILPFFQQGLGPKELALCLSITLFISTIPLIGPVTLLLTFFIVKFRLNLPLAMGFSYVLTPVQLLGILFFIRVGEGMMGLPPLPLDWEGLQVLLGEGPRAVFQVLSERIFVALGAWLLIAAPVSLLFYFLVYQGSRYFLRRRMHG